MVCRFQFETWQPQVGDHPCNYTRKEEGNKELKLVCTFSTRMLMLTYTIIYQSYYSKLTREVLLWPSHVQYNQHSCINYKTKHTNQLNQSHNHYNRSMLTKYQTFFHSPPHGSPLEPSNTGFLLLSEMLCCAPVHSVLHTQSRSA